MNIYRGCHFRRTLLLS